MIFSQLRYDDRLILDRYHQPFGVSDIKRQQYIPEQEHRHHRRARYIVPHFLAQTFYIFLHLIAHTFKSISNQVYLWLFFVAVQVEPRLFDDVQFHLLEFL